MGYNKIYVKQIIKKNKKIFKLKTRLQQLQKKIKKVIDYYLILYYLIYIR
jgi:hypothetical protein